MILDFVIQFLQPRKGDTVCVYVILSGFEFLYNII